jgi:uncharacterized RmlC-like cupin family protein
MKACIALAVFSLVLLSSAPVLAQDAVTADPAHYKVLIDNASVRVLKITYPVGATSKVHQHPDSIIVPLAGVKVRFTLPDKTSQDVEMASESATYAPAGTHTPTNIGTVPIDGLLVEFKAAAPGTATVPTSRPNMTVKVLAEGPRAVAYRTTADPSFSEPAGSKHDYDQIVIALGASQMSLSIDGKPAKTSWARGDAVFIGRGVPHESKNASTKPVEFVIVAVK